MNYPSILGIGDVLMRPKCFGFVQHRGVFLGGNAVITNTPDRGEHLATVDEFSAGERITPHRSGANPLDVLARGQRILAHPRKYDPIFRNCEHTASELTDGKAKSPSLTFVVVLAATIGVIYALTRRS
jgi:hypothetical protein